VLMRFNHASCERQFWRIVNASADLYADLKVDGEPLEIIAFDGMPLAFHNPAHPVDSASHILAPPAGGSYSHWAQAWSTGRRSHSSVIRREDSVAVTSHLERSVKGYFCA
jgi:hypothetical protein